MYCVIFLPHQKPDLTSTESIEILLKKHFIFAVTSTKTLFWEELEGLQGVSTSIFSLDIGF
jgi:hypothetical protein